MNTADTIAAVVVVVVVLVAALAAWRGRNEVVRDDPARSRDHDPAAVSAWHRATTAIDRVRRPR